MGSTAPQSVRVLYVDDEPGFTDLTAAALERADDRIRVETDTSVDGALDRLDDDVDCIVSDHDLSESSGSDLLEAVRERYPDLPFVLFTGTPVDELGDDTLAAVTDYLPKRAGADQHAELAARIVDAVTQRGTKRERRAGSRPDDPDTEETPGNDGGSTDSGTANGDGTAVDRDDPEAADGAVGLSPDEERALLEAVFEQVPAHLFVKDEEGRHLKVSSHFVERTEAPAEGLVDEYTRESLRGRRDIDIVDDEHARRAYEDDMRVIKTGKPVIRQEEYTDAHDEWDLTSKVPWRDGDGEIRGLIGITQRITARKRAERELQRQNERLEEFASVVSHDLRNPLNVAKGWTERAREEHDDPALDKVADALDRMEALIDDVLAVARSGRPVEETAAVDLGPLAEAAWETVATADATLVVDADRTVRADRDRLRRLLENLFRNAVEHGSTSPDSQARRDAGEHAGPDVTVTVDDLPDGFYVADDGPGIPEDEREAVFERGYTTAESGTGFGLSIVEEVAAAHGWDVRLTESDEGGARFEFAGVEFA